MKRRLFAPLSSHRKIIDSLIEQHHGRFVNSAGDSVLAEFASVVNAVQCAVDIQTALKAENANLPPERRMEFRIGVNLGDVMVEGEQIYGDGVNVAARLESLAEPGGICISGTVHEQIRNKLALELRRPRRTDGQEHRRAGACLAGAARTGRQPPRRTRRIPRRYWRGGVLSLTGLAIIVGTIVLVQTSVAQAAAYACLDSAAGEAGAAAAEHPLDCGVAVYESERRSQAGIFQRRHHRPAYQ